MLVSVILTPALLLGVANAATLAKRWSNGDVATGTTDPNVASGCTYWANSIASSDTCESLNAYFGITIAQLVSWSSESLLVLNILHSDAQSGDICLVQEILQQLSVITKKREETASTEDSPIRDTQDNTDEEDGARDWDGTLHWDLQQHPLYKEWYRVRDILFVQRAFLASISTGRKELVQCFLDSGAVAGFAFPANEKHPLPLSLAIRHGHEEIFDILVKHKARACGEDECPVVAAVKYHRFHELRVLVRLGDCGHWDEALSLALDTRPISDHMVDNGVEIKKYGHVALFGAITEGKKDWVEFLISQGADPNLCLSTESDIGGGEKKYSSIYHAILNGHLDVCKFLIEHGVQPEEDDLQLAREKEYDEIVGILSGFSYVDVPEKEDLITRWINTHS
ncbi:hypothetical protein KXW31_009157 [Aspergillus fumigatus]|nr:hypothetical protein KXX64_009128 [Aspergillus fumigatus]KAH3249963.1 hypothetical protein KXW31_009157 [Aspergillus fumigatus]